jgi:LPXTG-motif cell wall-anchored protein
MTLPAPAPVTPETKYTFLLPIGAVVLLGGSYLVLRRRRRPSTAPAA